MTEWKPKAGEWVLVRLERVTEHVASIDGERYLPLALYRQAPQPGPHQALKDAVVEAAIGWVNGLPGSHRVVKAVRALQTAQRPSSKYAGLRDAWR